MNDAFPLQTIERAVLARAKSAELDVSCEDGAARLFAFIHEEIDRWNLDFRRGIETIELTGAEALASRNLAGQGPLAPLLGIENCLIRSSRYFPSSAVTLSMT